MHSRLICSEKEMALILARMAAQILENNPDERNIMVIGIRRRGADLAGRIAGQLANAGKITELGSLDINLYRDDWTSLSQGMPSIGKSLIPASPDNKFILLVDDVLFSGRTVRSAMEAIFDYGRPKKIELAVLIDRGHRELPVCANYTGKHINTRKSEHIDVMVKERDGQDAVLLLHD